MIGGGSATTLTLPPATPVAPPLRVIVSITSKGEIFVVGTLVSAAAPPK